MAKKIDPTPELLEDMLARVPEGFLRQSDLAKKFKMNGDDREGALGVALERGQIAVFGDLIFDARRITIRDVQDRMSWCRPENPHLQNDGNFSQPDISTLLAERQSQMQRLNGGASRILHSLENGYAHIDELEQYEAESLRELLDTGVLKRHGDFIYDPLQLSLSTIQKVRHQFELRPLRAKIEDLLEASPGKTLPRETLYQHIEPALVNEILNGGGFSVFNVKLKTKPFNMIWVRSTASNKAEALRVARSAVRISDKAWDGLLEKCGKRLRPGARDGKSARNQVVARTYTVKKAAQHLALSKNAIERAIDEAVLPAFVDPEDTLRIPAEAVERAYLDADVAEELAQYEVVSVREIAQVSGLSFASIRRRLKHSGLHGGEVLWGHVQGRWRLPKTLAEFRTHLAEIDAETRAGEIASVEEQRRRLAEEQQEARRQRKVLRERLMSAFPTWRHERRNDQHVLLHVGPPNSGKTHDALEALTDVGSGWYLAPLRLLAYEVFDRLNERGVPCNLLTGEEFIPVPGASITAATIEMFNPHDSGDCVVIDEAQMLADPDRGWAWTRALMEAEAPEIHVIGPQTVEELMLKLVQSAELSMGVVRHKRLAPLRVAERNWPLHELPPHTILVAFSRRMVLHLKSELERMKRSVSVIYGGLPPEVRRKQADRFANGETEICVATDAVGMGLNLPADYVCFFEVEKFDGYKIRSLRAEEVQQIGGRAGRFGVREHGEIGATSMRNLKLVRDLYHQDVVDITHARIAPTVEDLEMLPGSLWERLAQWAQLESIPDALRQTIKTADLTERIELARMLTDEEVEQLGLEKSLKLINAPTRQSSRAYWYSCAKAILTSRWMPLPPAPPARINTSRDLETTEECIGCADIYLWLCSRREFSEFGRDEQDIRELRISWSIAIDDALLRKIDTARRCPDCSRPLPLGHRHRLCDSCYFRAS